MNLSKRLRVASRFLHFLFLQCHTHLPRQKCLAFAPPSETQQSGIGPIFVINLDRQPDRWSDVRRELACILDSAGKPLSERAVRYSACDAQTDAQESLDGGHIEPYDTLGDQLVGEPQPHAFPDAFDLARPISMSPAEIAVARSHVGVWKTIAESTVAYALVLEDDVWLERGFGRIVDQVWREMEHADRTSPAFDILYVSYKEVRYGAPKELVSKNVSPRTRALVSVWVCAVEKGSSSAAWTSPLSRSHRPLDKSQVPRAGCASSAPLGDQPASRFPFNKLL